MGILRGGASGLGLACDEDRVDRGFAGVGAAPSLTSSPTERLAVRAMPSTRMVASYALGISPRRWTASGSRGSSTR